MPQSEQKLGLAAVTSICLGAMLGSGIFVLPGMAAELAGPAMWIAYLLAGLCALPAALSTAELGTAMPTTGGKYVYLDRTFGPFWGTVAGLGLWLSLLLKAAFALVGFGAYLEVFATVPLKLTALILLLGISILNIMGVKKVGQIQVWIVSISVVGLLSLVCIGIPHFQAKQLTPLLPKGMGGLFAATSFVFVSYFGVTKAAAIAGDIKNPGRNLPLGILLSLGIAAILYGSIGLMLVGTQPLHDLQTDLHPIYSLAQTVGGKVVGVVIAILGIVTMTSMANTGLLAASRFPFAMARDRLLPNFLERLHPRFFTPVACIIATSITIGLTILFLQIQWLAKFASAFLLVIFISVNVAQMVLRYSNTPWYKPIFWAPFFPYTQILGITVGFSLLLIIGWIGLIAISSIVLLGSFIYFLYGRKYAERTGLLSRLSPKLDRRISISQAFPLPFSPESASQQSPIVVGLLGWERSPETLVEIAGAIANHRHLTVLHLTEVPEQTPIESVNMETETIKAIARRIRVMAQDQSLKLGLKTLLSQDVSHTLDEEARNFQAETLVLAWRGRRRLDPMNWLYRHSPCNLALFQDAGIRYIREILIDTQAGPHDSLVVSTANQLALQFKANLTFVHITGRHATAHETQSQEKYLQQLSQMCQAPTKILTLHGKDITQILIQSTQSYDLLIMSAPPEYAGRSMFAIQTLHDVINENAYCSVLTLQTSRHQTHESLTPDMFHDNITILHALHHAQVELLVPVRTKDDLFQFIASHFSQIFPGISSQQIATALQEREKEQNTAVGSGIALPHAHLSHATETRLGIFVTRSPINYHAPDNLPVDVVFAIIGPHSDRQTHLKLLSRISRLASKTSFLQQLRNNKDPHTILQILKEHCSTTGTHPAYTGKSDPPAQEKSDPPTQEVPASIDPQETGTQSEPSVTNNSNTRL